MRNGLSVKIASRGGLLAGASGASDRCKAFRDWFVTGCQGHHPSMGDPEKDWGEGFIITPDDQILTFGPTTFWLEKPFNGMFAAGSGREFALGAMAAGADAVRAIEIARTLDINTGGEITILTRALTHKTEEDA